MIEESLLIIKPDSYRRKLIGYIISILEQDGFEIKDIALQKLKRNEAERLYNEHRGKDFFEGLVLFMMEAPTVALILRRDNAIERLREIVGSTNPQDSKPGSIRALYGTDIRRNAVHASDSKESFKKELSVYFPSYNSKFRDETRNSEGEKAT